MVTDAVGKREDADERRAGQGVDDDASQTCLDRRTCRQAVEHRLRIGGDGYVAGEGNEPVFTNEVQVHQLDRW